MNSVINRTYEMFVRVLNFAAERADAFPPDTLGGQTVTELKRVVGALTEAGASQTSGLTSVQRATAERMAAREALRESMQALARTARVMALDTPGLEDKFRLPRSGSDPSLLQTARAFANDAAPLKDAFLRHAMHATFIEDFKEDIADLERAVAQQNTGRGAHVSATASVETEAERGMNAVRKLDAIVRNQFRGDPPTLAAWESARHVESSGRTRKRPNGSAGDAASGGGQRG
ncbi:MAG TPA: hypothetical protein VF611_12570 [Pyrinomonadaceae bacterium]|jgi:hypothetical protein